MDTNDESTFLSGADEVAEESNPVVFCYTIEYTLK